MTIIDNGYMTFNPVDYGFLFTRGWYAFDDMSAHKAARKARDDMAKKAKRDGLQVKKSRRSGQLITRGGIGTPNPEISVIVTVYCLSIQGAK